jgi:RimJ/RimL family protein N-acetyltransferase
VQEVVSSNLTAPTISSVLDVVEWSAPGEARFVLPFSPNCRFPLSLLASVRALRKLTFMTARMNPLGQPIGAELPGWQPPPTPQTTRLEGRLCRVVPLDVKVHAPSFFHACSRDAQGEMWTYLPYEPLHSFNEFEAWLVALGAGGDLMVHAILDSTSSEVVGIAAFMRITPASGSIEVGHVVFSPQLQRATLATEAMYLMMRRAFELGYRRYEWKCDALNAKSRAAAQRLGFSFEGIFRQATVYKNRTRDTAWFSVIDGEWPALRQAFERWLDASNFDADGRQRLRLSDLTAPLLKRPV